MSGPAFVVMPVQADGAQQSEQDTAKMASAIQQSLYENRRPNDQNRQGERGPLKELIAHQDSLYKYINWEDPVRTLGSYLGALSVLFGAHYLPLTQLALKIGAAILGIISLTEFSSRTFGPNTFLSRLRPKEYKTVPEPTLNATLRDIHDFIQYAVVQVQKIVFGQDLGKTFAAFLGFTTLFWLMKVVSPFSIAVLGLTTLYIAPLINSPHGRAVAQDATVRGKELANAATEKGNTLVQDSRAKAAELSSKAHEAVGGVQQRVGSLAQSGKQNANDLSNQASNRATDLRDMGIDAINKAPGITKLSSGDAEQYTYRSQSSTLDRGSDDYRYDTSGVANNASQFSSGIYDIPRQVAPYGNTANRTHYPNTTLDNREDMASSTSGQTAGWQMGSVADTDPRTSQQETQLPRMAL
ncbi:Reticulon-domain-containing protein [Fusarium oxysporum f. sp. albedinis]|nr:Reticulon-domain-containing protein [Fusarium oxysporum f. sp. albedinis]